jgi:adenylylsulfate kinase
LNNLFPKTKTTLTRSQKELYLNQKAKVLWFTGLSGSGKSTLAKALENELIKRGYFTVLIDGDQMRAGMNSDLGFSMEDRKENIRRVAELSKVLCQSGIICLNCFVSPTIAIRQLAKEIIGETDFVEIYVDTPLEVCEKRDVKGLYAKARRGELNMFTGIDSPFEPPRSPDIIIENANQNINQTVQECLTKVQNYL